MNYLLGVNQVQDCQPPRYQMATYLRGLVITEAIPGQSSWHLMAAHLGHVESTSQSPEFRARWECFSIIAQLSPDALLEALENLQELREYYSPALPMLSAKPNITIIPGLPGSVSQRPDLASIME